MSEIKRPVTVYAEATPNPDAMKFVASFLLLEEGIAEFHNKSEAVNSPLASQLFDFSGVKSVFITANFVTVTKQTETDWYDIVNILREFVSGYLATGEDIFNASFYSATSEKVNDITADKSANTSSLTGIEQKISDMLNDYVKPAVEQDGGAIHFKSFENGIVTVVLKGSCSGCPSSTLTLKSGIENLLTKMVPEVKEVVAEEG